MSDDDLVHWLEASLGSHVARRDELSREADQIAIHAQLARGCREQRILRTVEVPSDDRACDDQSQ